MTDRLQNTCLLAGSVLLAVLSYVVFFNEGSSADADQSQRTVLSDGAPKMDSRRDCYRIVECENYDSGGRRRRSVKVVFKNRQIPNEVIRQALLEVARRQDADVVFAYGYW
ncbi:MAG: hypothetical protein ACRDQW_18995, partial [Haloechinothrix sp.]